MRYYSLAYCKDEADGPQEGEDMALKIAQVLRQEPLLPTKDKAWTSLSDYVFMDDTKIFFEGINNTTYGLF